MSERKACFGLLWQKDLIAKRLNSAWAKKFSPEAKADGGAQSSEFQTEAQGSSEKQTGFALCSREKPLSQTQCHHTRIMATLKIGFVWNIRQKDHRREQKLGRKMPKNYLNFHCPYLEQVEPIQSIGADAAHASHYGHAHHDPQQNQLSSPQQRFCKLPSMTFSPANYGGIGGHCPWNLPRLDTNGASRRAR